MPYYNANKNFSGKEPKTDICQYNPVKVLVLEDIYDSDTIRNNTQQCCDLCQEKKCLLNCDIIGKLSL